MEKKLFFITTNIHKVEEASAVLKEFGVKVEQYNVEYPEDKDGTIQDLVRKAIKPLAEIHKKPVVIEDTGLFFDAFGSFPGLFPKFVYKQIGFEGIQKLLDGKSRKAYFMSVIGYCEPGKEPLLFEGKLNGTIKPGVLDAKDNIFPYDSVFIPEGHDVTFSAMTDNLKNSFSHRSKAFRKLGEYLTAKVKFKN